MKFFKHYKEILFGFALGAAMWLIDAVDLSNAKIRFCGRKLIIFK